MKKTNELMFELPIQFFNDGGNGDGAEPTGGAQEPAGGTESQNKSFDELLGANKDYQSEFDKRIAKALETNATKLNEEFEKKLNDSIEEQKRLAGLDEETKVKEQEKARLKEFEEREAKLTRKELETDVKDLLTEANLSKDFLDFVVATDVESSKQRIEALTTMINAQVEKGVQEKITGSGTPGKVSGSVVDEQIANAFAKKY